MINVNRTTNTNIAMMSGAVARRRDDLARDRGKVVVKTKAITREKVVLLESHGM